MMIYKMEYILRFFHKGELMDNLTLLVIGLGLGNITHLLLGKLASRHNKPIDIPKQYWGVTMYDDEGNLTIKYLEY